MVILFPSFFPFFRFCLTAMISGRRSPPTGAEGIGPFWTNSCLFARIGTGPTGPLDHKVEPSRLQRRGKDFRVTSNQSLIKKRMGKQHWQYNSLARTFQITGTFHPKEFPHEFRRTNQVRHPLSQASNDAGKPRNATRDHRLLQ